MIEEVYHLAQGNSKTIEKVLMDEDIHYMHMILNTNEGLPAGADRHPDGDRYSRTTAEPAQLMR